MAFIIRPAAHTDLPGILAIYSEAVLHTTASYDYEPSTLEARTAWYESHVQQRLPIFVAEQGDSVVGWSALHTFRPKVGYLFTAENSVYVAADRRRQGIGRALIVPLIRCARQLGMHALIAEIDAENTPSLRLHAGLGFVQVAHFREVGYKFGHWLDLVCMELLLNTTGEESAD
jgi:L-amino acid N-acyltransferase YncA